MLVRISHPTCCPPTLMPTLSAHPLCAPAATLSMPLPPARRPLRPAALSVPPPPPSLSHRHSPLHPAAAAGSARIHTELHLHGRLRYTSWQPSWAAKGQGQRRRGRIRGVRHATRTPPRCVHCAVACHRAAATLYTPPLPSTSCRHPLHTAAAALSMTPPLPLCAIAGLTTGRCLYVQHCPCPWPSCMRHMQPGPLSGHTWPSHASRPRPHLSYGLTRHPSLPPMSRPRPWPHPRPCPASRPPSRVPSPPGPHPQLCPTSQPLSQVPSPPGPHQQPCDAIT